MGIATVLSPVVGVDAIVALIVWTARYAKAVPARAVVQAAAAAA